MRWRTERLEAISHSSQYFKSTSLRSEIFRSYCNAPVLCRYFKHEIIFFFYVIILNFNYFYYLSIFTRVHQILSLSSKNINDFVTFRQMFNPKLTGYSTGTGEFISTAAKLNIAYPVAATEDALHQARILVQRIKSDPTINVRKHWKVE